MDDSAIERGERESWGAEVAELAFELWHGDAARKLPRVVELLAEFGHPVPYRTVYDWRSRYQWDIEADERDMAYAPILKSRREKRLDIASARASIYVDEVLAGLREPSKELTAVAKLALEAARVTGIGAKLNDPEPQPRVIAFAVPSVDLGSAELRLAALGIGVGDE